MARIQQTVPHAGKDVHPQEGLSISEGNAQWNGYFGRQFGSFLQS